MKEDNCGRSCGGGSDSGGCKGMKNTQTPTSTKSSGAASSAPPSPALMSNKSSGLVNELHALNAWWNEFFYARTSQMETAAWIRRAFSLIMVANVTLLIMDWYLFGPLLPVKVTRQLIDPDTLTVFSLSIFPDKYHIYGWYWCWCSAVLMGLDIFPRVNAFFVYFWYVQFMHRNLVIWDGEDTVFRLLSFFFIFFPPPQAKSWPMWPFRIMQYEMVLIFFSAVSIKLSGYSWFYGQAMYVIAQGEMMFGGIYNPEWLFGYSRPLVLITYVTLVTELCPVVALWYPRTRIPVLVIVLLFHLGIDVSMNLNFFHTIMMVGWLSFFIQPDADQKQYSEDIGGGAAKEQQVLSASLNDGSIDYNGSSGIDLHSNGIIDRQSNLNLETEPIRHLLMELTKATVAHTQILSAQQKDAQIQFALQNKDKVGTFQYIIEGEDVSGNNIRNTKDSSDLMGTILWTFRQDQGYPLPKGYLLPQNLSMAQQHLSQRDYEGFRVAVVNQLHQLLGSKPRLQQQDGRDNNNRNGHIYTIFYA